MGCNCQVQGCCPHYIYISNSTKWMQQAAVVVVSVCFFLCQRHRWPGFLRIRSAGEVICGGAWRLTSCPLCTSCKAVDSFTAKQLVLVGRLCGRDDQPRNLCPTEPGREPGPSDCWSSELPLGHQPPLILLLVADAGYTVCRNAVNCVRYGSFYISLYRS